MNHRKTIRLLSLSLPFGLMLSACGTDPEAPRPGAEHRLLDLYIWNNFLAADTISNFEKQTGIKVSQSNYSSDEQLEGKLATGQSGYDVVVPSGSFYERQIQAGYYGKLDKSRLPNLSNMDPRILQRMAVHDPNNDHAVLHSWGTEGLRTT